MARTYNKSAAKPSVKTESAKPAEAKTEAVTETKADIQEEASASVIAAPEEAVMQRIVYQHSAQILEREAAPNEAFGVGDDMPVYYL